jgi:outer membrane receptor protein involved in Fe transport
MKKDFVGVRLDAQYSFYQDNNDDAAVDAVLAQGIGGNGIPLNGPHGSTVGGGAWDVTAIVGVNAPDGKGNITAYVGYRHVDPILSATRDYAYCEIGTIASGSATINGRSVYDTHLCFGSANSAYGRFIPLSGPNAALDAVFADNPDGAKSFVPYSPAYDYNFAPTQYSQSENNRYSGGYFAHYDLNKYISLYSNFMFSDNETVGQLGPSGLFADTPYYVNCNNPLMSPSQAAALCGAAAGTAAIAQTLIGYRFADVAGAVLPRGYDYVHDSFLVNLGAKGTLGGGWSYDAYLQEGYTLFNETIIGQYSQTAIQDALLVNPGPGGGIAGATCQSGGACVPLNVFQIGGITPAMANSLAVSGIEDGFTQEQVAELDVVGDLGHYGIRSPWATEGIGIALGADYRQESLGLQVDPLTASGDIAGSGGPTHPASGQYDIKELYGELRVPILQNKPFARLLQFEGGYRLSDYSTAAGATQSYKLSGEWAPTEDIRLRGGYNVAVRAPNIVELHTPQTPGLYTGDDPCAGRIIAPGSANYAGCLASGATPAQLASGIIDCPAGQCGILTGGNPNLKPETADTYTAGLVITPRWVPGLSLTIDYYNIKVTNIIEEGLGGASVELSQCVSTLNPLYCGFIKRDPILGTIWANGGLVESINVNAGSLQTTGFDLEFNYRFRFTDFHLPDLGSLTVNFVGGYVSSLTNTPIPGAGSFNCAGLYGAVCGEPTPKWRSKLRLTWTAPSWPVTVSLQWRYLGAVAVDINSNNPLLQGGDACCYDTLAGEAVIPQYSYFDLSGTWRFMNRYTVRAGINNILDNRPPVIDTGILGLSGLPFGNGNAYPNGYDSLGRELFIGLTADF